MKSSIYTNEHRKLIDKLKKARLAAQLDQKQAAKLLGTTQSYISKLESGQRQVNVIQLKELAKVYKKDPSSFIK